jgi:hypothetical protein
VRPREDLSHTETPGEALSHTEILGKTLSYTENPGKTQVKLRPSGRLLATQTTWSRP